MEYHRVAAFVFSGTASQVQHCELERCRGSVSIFSPEMLVFSDGIFETLPMTLF